MENGNLKMESADMKKEEVISDVIPEENRVAGGFLTNLKWKILNKPFMKDLEGDKLHVLVLFFLYILQGIPLGLISSVPLVLGKKDVSYKEQAKFSISGYPFSMKLLWAPLVDSVYIARFGRRKSWLVPVQYIIGIMMVITSQYVGRMLGDSEDPEEKLVPDVSSLAATFFILNFLAATQDVAVDGWALTMLKPKNVGYASTCNSVGQTTGWCLGYILFLTMEGAGLINLGQFLLFWGIVFLITTTLIAIFKREKNTGSPSTDPEAEAEEAEPDLNMWETYCVLWKIAKQPKMWVYGFFLLTAGIGYAAVEAMTSLKLVERGVPKAKIALLEIPMIPVKIILTLFLTRWTIGPRPMNVWLLGHPWRLIFCLFMVLVVYLTPQIVMEDGSFPVYYYVIIMGVLALHKCGVYAKFVAGMAFHARLSDPAVGGTYMTFLNTLSNLGTLWPRSFTLWLVDLVTWKQCVPGEEDEPPSLPGALGVLGVSSNATAIAENVCYGTAEVESCKGMGGSCSTLTDGYFSISIISAVIGLIWFIWAVRVIRKLQTVEVQEWRVVKGKKAKDESSTAKEENFKYFYCF